MHVLLVPGVVFLANPRRAVFARRLLIQPHTQIDGGGLRRCDRRIELVVHRFPDHLAEPVQIPGIAANVTYAGHPEVARIACQVTLRLGK